MGRAKVKKREAGLGREKVIDAALKLLDRAGLDGLTVRALAAELGVQNPALYWHFRNKQEIVDSVAERLLTRSVVRPRPKEAWSKWLPRTGRAFRAALRSCRDGARVVAGADLSSSAMGAHLDGAIQLLMAAGFSPVDALFGVVAVFDFTLGATFESDEDPRVGRAKQKADPKAPFPALQAALHAAAKKGFDEDATFEYGLALLVDGLAARRKPRRA